MNQLDQTTINILRNALWEASHNFKDGSRKSNILEAIGNVIADMQDHTADYDDWSKWQADLISKITERVQIN